MELGNLKTLNRPQVSYCSRCNSTRPLGDRTVQLKHLRLVEFQKVCMACSWVVSSVIEEIR